MRGRNRFLEVAGLLLAAGVAFLLGCDHPSRSAPDGGAVVGSGGSNAGGTGGAFGSGNCFAGQVDVGAARTMALGWMAVAWLHYDASYNKGYPDPYPIDPASDQSTLDSVDGPVQLFVDSGKYL